MTTKQLGAQIATDPEVQRAMNALHAACQAAAARSGDTLKTLALVIHSEAGADTAIIGCPCPTCTGYVLGAMGSAFYSQLAEAGPVSRLPTTAGLHS